MYTIPKPSKRVLDDHANDLLARIKTQVERFLPDYKHESITILNNKKIKLEAKVSKGSITEWFLKKLHNDAYLRNLLTGDMTCLLGVLAELENERVSRRILPEYLQKSMTQDMYEKKCGKLKGKKVKRVYDCFNDILYNIFVVNGYAYQKTIGGKKDVVFDKSKHVEELGLRICPYCGRAFVYGVTVGGTHVKPQIDHFLPKRKYPFFALSYFNLIPVCSTCNMKDCKGENDPIVTSPARPFRMIYPYEFKDGDIQFKYGLHGANYNQDKNFSVSIDYKGKSELEKGSRDIMKLDEFYAHHNHEAASIYRQLMILKSKAVDYYTNFKVPKTKLRVTPSLLLGFTLNESSSRIELLYKFKKDIYLLLVDDVYKL